MKTDDPPRPAPLRDDPEAREALDKMAALRKRLAEADAALHELAGVDPQARSAEAAARVWRSGTIDPARHPAGDKKRADELVEEAATLRRAIAIGEELLPRIKTRLYREHAARCAKWRADLAREMLAGLKRLQELNSADARFHAECQATFGTAGQRAHLATLGYPGGRDNNTVTELAAHMVQAGILAASDGALAGTGVAPAELRQAAREQAREREADGVPSCVVARVLDAVPSAAGG